LHKSGADPLVRKLLILIVYTHMPLCRHSALCSVLIGKAVRKVLIKGLADEKNPSQQFASI